MKLKRCNHLEMDPLTKCRGFLCNTHDMDFPFCTIVCVNPVSLVSHPKHVASRGMSGVAAMSGRDLPTFGETCILWC
jgi:hypothetical protein